MKILAAVVIGTITGFVVAFKQSLVLPRKASWSRIHSVGEPQFFKDYIDTKIELEISKSEKLLSKVEEDTAKILTKKVDENSKEWRKKVDENLKMFTEKVDENSKMFTGEIKELTTKVDENSKELSKKVDNLDLEFQAWTKAFTIFAGVSSIIVAANIPTFLKDIFSIK